MAPRYTASRYHLAVSPLPQPRDGPCLSLGPGAPRTSVPAYCCHNRCLQHGLGHYMQRAGSLGALDRAPTALAHQLPRAVGSVSSPTAVPATAVGQARASPHGQHCGCLVHQLAGRYTITPHVTARPPSPPLESHAVQVTARCSQAGEAQSCGEWRLHPEKPHWPTRTWFPDLISLVTAPPWRIPLRKDILSQGLGTIWHPRPDLWNLHVWLLNGTRQTWAVYDGRSMGKHDLIVRFLKGARRMNPSKSPLVPSWNLSIVTGVTLAAPFPLTQGYECLFSNPVQFPGWWTLVESSKLPRQSDWAEKSDARPSNGVSLPGSPVSPSTGLGVRMAWFPFG